MKKIIISAFILIFSVFLFAHLHGNGDNKPTAYSPVKPEYTKIAACPTYYEEAEAFDKDIFNIIKTASTAESLALLSGGRAGYILAGRTLKPGEGKYEAVVLGHGYSFLAGREAVISEADFSTLDFFTDLSEDEIIEKFGIINITAVDDVYEHLDQGMIITSWENTDYGRAQIAHVLDKNGSRVRLSRCPVLYCANTCDLTVVENVKKQFN